MGYRIEYTLQGAVHKAEKWTFPMKLSMWLGIAAGVALGLWVFFPQQILQIRELIVPGKEAFQSFIAQLESGTQFADAVTTFCREWLHEIS